MDNDGTSSLNGTSDTVQMVTESHVVETRLNHLTPKQKDILNALLQPGASVDAAIPSDVVPKEAWEILQACVSGLTLLENRVTRLKPIIGRIIVTFENRPSLYKELGYQTFHEFMENGVYATLGLRRSSAYEALQVAKKWPALSPDQYAAVGPKKIAVLSKFTNGSSTNAATWIDTAKRMPLPQLRVYVAERGLLGAGETIGAIFQITTNRDDLKLFETFFKDGRIQSVVGSKDRSRILVAMIQETFDEWVQRYEDERASKFQQNGNHKEE